MLYPVSRLSVGLKRIKLWQPDFVLGCCCCCKRGFDGFRVRQKSQWMPQNLASSSHKQAYTSCTLILVEAPKHSNTSDRSQPGCNCSCQELHNSLRVSLFTGVWSLVDEP
ncbi:uncharacterized protein LOC144547214 [Carex rostrata]